MRGRLLLLVMSGAVLIGSLAAAEEPSQKTGFRYDAAGRRDPFMPLVLNNRLVSTGGGGSRDLSQPVLRGILWDPSGRSIALIDELEAKVGDTVRGYRVAAIRRDEVVLESEDGQSMVLQIAFETPSSGTTTGGEHP